MHRCPVPIALTRTCTEYRSWILTYTCLTAPTVRRATRASPPRRFATWMAAIRISGCPNGRRWCGAAHSHSTPALTLLVSEQALRASSLTMATSTASRSVAPRTPSVTSRVSSSSCSASQCLPSPLTAGSNPWQSYLIEALPLARLAPSSHLALISGGVLVASPSFHVESLWQCRLRGHRWSARPSSYSGEPQAPPPDTLVLDLTHALPPPPPSTT